MIIVYWCIVGFILVSIGFVAGLYIGLTAHRSKPGNEYENN